MEEERRGEAGEEEEEEEEVTDVKEKRNAFRGVVALLLKRMMLNCPVVTPSSRVMETGVEEKSTRGKAAVTSGGSSLGSRSEATPLTTTEPKEPYLLQTCMVTCINKQVTAQNQGYTILLVIM